MSEHEYVRFGLRILDEQLVDATGRRCGRVEDLEFDAGPGRQTHAVAFLCGATAWKRRLPPRMAELVPGDPRGLKRVPWDAVAEVANEIELRLAEGDLEPASGGHPVGPLTLSSLLGAPVLDSRGASLGKVRDVIGVREAEAEENTPWRLYGLLVGRRALLQRAGFEPELGRELAEGRRPANLIEWERVERQDEEGRLILLFEAAA